MTHTFIFKIRGFAYPYRVKYCADPDKYLDGLNIRRAECVHVFEGNFEREIRVIGVGKMVKILEAKDNSLASMINLLP